MKTPFPRHEHEAKAVFDWNSKHPIGTFVTVLRDNGQVQRTRTRGLAWCLSGHSAVILLEGISGAYSLKRVKYEPPVTITRDNQFNQPEYIGT